MNEAWRKYEQKQLLMPSRRVKLVGGMGVVAISTLWALVADKSAGGGFFSLTSVLVLAKDVLVRMALLIIVILSIHILRSMRDNTCKQCGGRCEKRSADYTYWVCDRCKIRWNTGISPKRQP